jgi:uncharacterized RDD family membrane protein YckC
MRLPFDAVENSFSGAPGRASVAVSAPPGPTVARSSGLLSECEEATASCPTDLSPKSAPASQTSAVSIEYETSNLIEFPRSAAIPIFRGSELAEPVLDRPRIVEAPEVIPPAPALGGILIETMSHGESEKRTATEFLRQPASLARRLAAGAMDALILTTALLGFAAIFHRINPGRLPIALFNVALLVVAAMLWLAYEFLFVVYTGSTPGWRLARLRLAKFDGSPARRDLRRWRVLASFLSAFSLGLGYLWSILDEDELCWHDRITHTYLRWSNPVILSGAGSSRSEHPAESKDPYLRL